MPPSWYVEPDDPDARRRLEWARRIGWADVSLNCLVPAVLGVVVCLVLIVRAVF